MRVCPVTCPIVKTAITYHRQFGMVMHKYVDEQKETSSFCNRCDRNEKSTMPEQIKRDMSKEKIEDWKSRA